MTLTKQIDFLSTAKEIGDHLYDKLKTYEEADRSQILQLAMTHMLQQLASETQQNAST